MHWKMFGEPPELLASPDDHSSLRRRLQRHARHPRAGDVSRRNRIFAQAAGRHVAEHRDRPAAAWLLAEFSTRIRRMAFPASSSDLFRCAVFLAACYPQTQSDSVDLVAGASHLW